jgi:hypothetical protein
VLLSNNSKLAGRPLQVARARDRQNKTLSKNTSIDYLLSRAPARNASATKRNAPLPLAENALQHFSIEESVGVKMLNSFVLISVVLQAKLLACCAAASDGVCDIINQVWITFRN